MTTTSPGPADTGAGRAAIAARTLRTDRWWIPPLVTAAGLIAWIAYATVRVFMQKDYFVGDYNYLTPFFGPDNFLQSHFENPEITSLLDLERTTADENARMQIIGQIQTELATNYLPTLPLLEGKQIAVATDEISGVDETLDASFKFRFVTLAKS